MAFVIVHVDVQSVACACAVVLWQFCQSVCSFSLSFTLVYCIMSD